MNRFQYPVLLSDAEEGGYVVTCRDLPQLVTQGESEQDALEQASDAMDEVFATYLIEGIDFPVPTKARRREHLVSPPAGTVAKAALYVACSIRTMAPSCRVSRRPSVCLANAS